MIQNREQLIMLANQWVRMACQDLKNKVRDFIDATRTPNDELAYVLGISDSELNHILDGDGQFSIDTFAKLLIANDLALEIKPVSETPIGSYGNSVDVDDVEDDEDDELDDFDGETSGVELICDFIDNHPSEEPQPRDSRGRFMRRNANENRESVREQAVRASESSAPRNTPYDNMPTEHLKDLIVRNLWETEIDVENATRKEMIDFILGKEELMMRRFESRREEIEGSRRATEVSVDEESKDERKDNDKNIVEAFIDTLREQAMRNPRLAQIIRDFANTNVRR